MALSEAVRRVWSVPAAAVVLGCLAGCAAAQQAPLPPGAVLLTAPEAATLRQAAARVEPLEAAVRQLRQRLHLVEERVGLAPLRGLERPPLEERLRLGGTAQLVATVGQRAQRRTLASALRGHSAAVFSFWATWCKPCTSPEELAHLGELKTQLSARGAVLISVAVDSLDKVQVDPRASTWLYPLWQRTDAHLEMLPRSFISRVGVNLPLFLVVSPDGRIRFVHNRKLNAAAVRDLVTAAAFGGAP